MHLECWTRIYKHIHTSLYKEHKITRQRYHSLPYYQLVPVVVNHEWHFVCYSWQQNGHCSEPKFVVITNYTYFKMCILPQYNL